MGYIYVFMSGDIEGAHHILFCMVCIAFNTPSKMIMLLVGLLGNNGKTMLMGMMGNMLFGDTMGSVPLSTLCEGKDSNAHAGNLIPLLGKKSIMCCDECGVD